MNMAMTREDMVPIEVEIVDLLHKKTETLHDAQGVLAAVTLAIQEEEIRNLIEIWEAWLMSKEKEQIAALDHPEEKKTEMTEMNPLSPGYVTNMRVF
jgi:hypothetical protein